MITDKIGYMVIADVLENEDGSATYTFDLDKQCQKVVVELGLRLTLICAAYGIDIEDALQSIAHKENTND